MGNPVLYGLLVTAEVFNVVQAIGFWWTASRAGPPRVAPPGTNVVFRRSALESVGGIPEDSVTEDFDLSIYLREQGWRSVYVPEILAAGLGPEDVASYVSQQRRWARGCLSAISTAARARLPLIHRVQFLLSSMFFLTGWTYLVYMTLPIVRIVGGQQALAGTTANQFLAHFAPYFGASMLTVAVGGAGAYSFAAFALMEASFWIHVEATLKSLLGIRGRFVVTPKIGRSGRQPRAVIPALVALPCWWRRPSTGSCAAPRRRRSTMSPSRACT